MSDAPIRTFDARMGKGEQKDMRGCLPGTRHTTLLHREEPGVVEALLRLPFVKKVEPLFLNWTGPTRPRLAVFRVARGVVETVLFLGNGKRRVLILLHPQMLLSRDELIYGFRDALRHFDIDVQAKGEISKMSQTTHETDTQLASNETTPNADAWSWCMTIHEHVAQFKKLEEDEIQLELQLEEVRQQKRGLQEAAVRYVTAKTMRSSSIPQ